MLFLKILLEYDTQIEEDDSEIYGLKVDFIIQNLKKKKISK